MTIVITYPRAKFNGDKGRPSLKLGWVITSHCFLHQWFYLSTHQSSSLSGFQPLVANPIVIAKGVRTNIRTAWRHYNGRSNKTREVYIIKCFRLLLHRDILLCRLLSQSKIYSGIFGVYIQSPQNMHCWLEKCVWHCSDEESCNFNLFCFTTLYQAYVTLMIICDILVEHSHHIFLYVFAICIYPTLYCDPLCKALTTRGCPHFADDIINAFSSIEIIRFLLWP